MSDEVEPNLVMAKIYKTGIERRKQKAASSFAAPPCSASRWDCHEHREELKVSEHATVYHSDHGQLSVLEKHWDVYLWHPIGFKDKPAAWKWIQEGYIAELQEGLGNLGVAFTKTSCEPRV